MKELLIKTFSDDDFIRSKVPMTKESVRHLSIIKLGLCEGDTVYDIGSGTGSIACEAAAQSGSLEVYAIEMKPEACGLIRQNASKFGLSNIKVVEEKAPAAFNGLPAPSCAFIGGSSGNLKEILTSLSSAPKGVRVVINAVSLETMAEIQSVLKEFDLRDLSIEQVSVSKARELGSYHLMTAENPVMIASFTIGGRA